MLKLDGKLKSIATSMRAAKSAMMNFRPSNGVASIFWMVLHTLSMSALYVYAKKLTNTLHPYQVTFLYKFSVLIAIIPWYMIGGFKKNLKTKKIGIHVTRGTFSVMATLSFFYGLRGINISDAAAVTYLEPIIVMAIGVFYFKERLTSAKLLAITCGILGVSFVIKPGFQSFNAHYIFLFLALCFWAINNLSIKVLGRTESTKTQLFYAMLLGSTLSLPLAIQAWQPLYLMDFAYIIILAVLHMVHIVSFFKAFKFSDISAVIPLDYLRLIFTGVFGYLAFSEIPDEQSLVGYGLILLGGFYLLQDEGRRGSFGSKKKNMQQTKQDNSISSHTDI